MEGWDGEEGRGGKVGKVWKVGKAGRVVGVGTVVGDEGLLPWVANETPLKDTLPKEYMLATLIGRVDRLTGV